MMTVMTVCALLLLIATFQGTLFYFAKLRVTFFQWLFFNPCAVSNIVFLAGFALFLLKGNRILLYPPLLPMFFFGTLGFFFLPWTGMNLIAQAGHAVMTANIVLSVYETFAVGEYRPAALGLMIGIVIFAPFIALQQDYVRADPEAFAAALSGTEPRSGK